MSKRECGRKLASVARLASLYRATLAVVGFFLFLLLLAFSFGSSVERVVEVLNAQLLVTHKNFIEKQRNENVEYSSSLAFEIAARTQLAHFYGFTQANKRWAREPAETRVQKKSPLFGGFFDAANERMSIFVRLCRCCSLQILCAKQPQINELRRALKLNNRRSLSADFRRQFYELRSAAQKLYASWWRRRWRPS